MNINSIVKVKKPTITRTSKQDKMIDNYLRSIVFSDTPEAISDILSIVECPFIENEKTDIVSLISQRFYNNSAIPLGLPIFTFFSIVSAWLVKNRTKMRISDSIKNTELATWTISLAPSGSYKSTVISMLESIIPVDDENHKIVGPDFIPGATTASFLQALSELEDGRGWWQEDEFAQIVKQLERPGSLLYELRGDMLKIKDNNPVIRKTLTTKIETDPIVLVQSHFNTVDGFTRSISEESLKDGLLRRWTIINLTKDSRDFTNYPRIKHNAIIEDSLKNAMITVFDQNIEDVTYTFSEEADALYSKMYKAFWQRQYSKFMSDCIENYTTYMFEAHKYAVFHHFFHKKEGTLIGADSMQYALKVVMYMLNSLQQFIMYRGGSRSLKFQATKVDQIRTHILENETKKGISTSLIYRKFNIKKDEFESILKSIAIHDKTFKSSLLKKFGIE
jgi:hypothetical protein